MSEECKRQKNPAGGEAGGGPGIGFRTAETLLRVVPMGLCVAALVIMVKNTEEDRDLGSVSYAHFSAFRYLVCANGVCAAYSLFSAFYSVVLLRPATATLSLSWAMFLLDQVLTFAILAAAAVSGEIIYLAYRGDQKLTWSEECSVWSGFCKSATASAGITSAAAACYILLSLFSSYRLFDAYY